MVLPMQGIRPASESSIEIEFEFQGRRCVERLRMKPNPANLQKAAQRRAEILACIARGEFDHEALTGKRFPDSP